MGKQFTIRDSMFYNTESYQYLPEAEQKSIYDLYHDYIFFRRQDHLWFEKAMEKLPVILNATKMLIWW